MIALIILVSFAGGVIASMLWNRFFKIGGVIEDPQPDRERSQRVQKSIELKCKHYYYLATFEGRKRYKSHLSRIDEAGKVLCQLHNGMGAAKRSSKESRPLHKWLLRDRADQLCKNCVSLARRAEGTNCESCDDFQLRDGDHDEGYCKFHRPNRNVARLDGCSSDSSLRR